MMQLASDMINHIPAELTRKPKLMQKGMHDSSACLKARCEQNLSSPIPATDITW